MHYCHDGTTKCTDNRIIMTTTDMLIIEIEDLPYFDNFSNVIVSDINKSIPKSVTNLTFGSNFNEPINDFVPESVTCLTFCAAFNQGIYGCIPYSVTYLEFGKRLTNRFTVAYLSLLYI